MRTLDQLRTEIHKTYKKHKSWRFVAAQFGINPGTAWDIYHGHEPKSPALRDRLGLPALGYASVCIRCGQVHVTKRCTAQQSAPRDLFAMPTNELLWRLENRE